MHLTFYCNQTGQPQKREKNVTRPQGSTYIDVATSSQQCCCCSAIKQCLENDVYFIYLLTTHLLYFPLFPYSQRCLLLIPFNLFQAFLVQNRCLWMNPVKVQFSYYIINVFIKDKMPWVFPLEKNNSHLYMNTKYWKVTAAQQRQEESTTPTTISYNSILLV